LKVDDDERTRYLTTAEEKRLRDALVTRETRLRLARDRFNRWRAVRNKAQLAARKEEFVDHIRPLVLLALNTGLRRGELFSLLWGDIDLDGRMLNTEAVTVLKAWRKQTPGERVFPGAGGERLTDCKRAWATVCKIAKVTGFRFHDCRHNFASRLVQAGIDLNTVRALMGHADLKMTLRYSHLQPENLHAAVAKLAS
jgi:integrase